MSRFRSFVRIASLALCLVLSGTGLAYSSSSSQLPVVGDFSGAQAGAGWKLSGSAALTAPGLDKPGEGVLRLTASAPHSHGQARFVGGSFWPNGGLIVSFSYASWGGGVPGADGIVVFLYDAARDMSGAALGGGMGYCAGAGAFLALALDEYGNFSDPAACPGGKGPGRSPQSLVLRGPGWAGNPYLAHSPIPRDIDHPVANARPGLKQVILSLVPRPGGTGYEINVDVRANPTDPLVRVLHKVDFPYDAPQALSVGVAGTTGGARNIHEIRHLTVSSLASGMAPQLQIGFLPPAVPAGEKTTMILAFQTPVHGGAVTLAPLAVKLPGDSVVADPLQLTGTCPGAAFATAGGNLLVADAGTRIRPRGCTWAVVIQARTPGTHTSHVGAGEIQTDLGSNIGAASATLTVAPRSR